MNTSALGPMTVISMEGEAKTSTEKLFRGAWRAAITLLVGILLFLAWLVWKGDLYEAGSDFGYNLGLIGGLLMLSLLIYPIRKRLGSYDRFGKMESWFKFHMVAGIGGPILVLIHSTFRTGSMNGAIALYAMLLVAISGVAARFFYRRVHLGMYGKRLTLDEASTDLKACAENLGSVFALRPDIEPRLQEFQAEAFDTEGSWSERAWKFIALRWKSRELARELRRDAKSALRKQGRLKRIQHRELILNYQLARRKIDKYLDAVVKASQLSVWERLFSYWHIIHIPFLYLLVFSGVVHVVAVHMY